MVRKAEWSNLLPMPEKTEEFVLNLTLTEDEIKILQLGHYPKGMEDKWFAYYENGNLYLHRSWSGKCVYIVDLTVHSQFKVIKDSAYINDCSFHSEQDFLSTLLRNWIKKGLMNYEETKTESAKTE